MKNYWKQFVEWVIGLRHNVFLLTRLKLTVLYAGIICVIVVIFSVVLTYSLSKNIRDNFEGDTSNDQTQELAITKTIAQLQTTIIIIDFFVVLISGGLAYFLAGATLRPIQEALERQKQFTADASHELRMPLAVMRADLEVALREKELDQEKMRARIRSAIEEVDKMTGFTSDLLMLARFDNGKASGVFKKVDMTQLIYRVVKKMEALAKDKGISLSHASFPPTFVIGDASAMEHLFTNVISNAIQFTLKDGSVRITMEQHNSNIVVGVKDTGAGIAEEDLPHIFERFYRADKARTRARGGTGLGLSIAQEIAHAHKGAIRIKSKIGKGTLVTVTFPSIS